jgi:hypothetical protein
VNKFSFNNLRKSSDKISNEFNEFKDKSINFELLNEIYFDLVITKHSEMDNLFIVIFDEIFETNFYEEYSSTLPLFS